MSASLKTSPLPLRIGLFGIGLDAYWPQFTGLKDRLEGYLQRVGEKLQSPGERGRSTLRPDRHARPRLSRRAIASAQATSI